jgi:hypothetical protein
VNLALVVCSDRLFLKSVSQIARGNGETRFEASGVLARAADWLEQGRLLAVIFAVARD